MFSCAATEFTRFLAHWRLVEVFDSNQKAIHTVEIGERMIHDKFLDRHGKQLNIGDVVIIHDKGFPDILGTVTCFFQKWSDPIVQIRYSNTLSQRESHELELASDEEAMLFKLENS
jgi:hypothetical protein